MRYMKKQPDNSVEAVQWDGTAEGAEKVIRTVGAGCLKIDHTRKSGCIEIEPDGTKMTLHIGDWLILHQEGPPSVMDDKTFRQNYEAPARFTSGYSQTLDPRCPPGSVLWWWENGKFTNGVRTISVTA